MIESTEIYKKVEVITRTEFPQGASFLLAISGGADSMALLHIFNKLREIYPYRIEVCSIDHGIRSESRHEVESVKGICSDLNIPCWIFHGNLPADASEEDARQFRHGIFKNLLKDKHHDYLVTGHHSDDQAETLLMRIIRGCGPGGLKAMKVKDGHIFRPLLVFRRTDIRNFLISMDISWFEDSTNESSAYFRNRIRNEVMPLLLQENPQIVRSLVNLSSSITEEHDSLLGFCHSIIDNSIRLPNGICIHSTSIPASTGAIMNIFKIVWEQFKHSGEIGRDHLQTIHDDFINRRKFSRGNLPGGLIVTWLNDYVFIGNEFKKQDFEIPIKPELAIPTPRGVLKLVPDPKGKIKASTFPLALRNRRPGDRINRMHMGLVKLKTIHEKYPVPFRHQLLVLVDQNENILWAEGAGKAYGISGDNYDLVWESDDLSPDRFLR
ncbi:tRNA lysidine(34) synthetase TilS [Myxococcota bacterium]|nr:tRNA lysidine(34) synthetase TilS [Myxococcota bacterium]MBU1498808.1 tRNA lysidine(34) synthetase TilS [Myxococcota bacterium]